MLFKSILTLALLVGESVAQLPKEYKYKISADKDNLNMEVTSPANSWIAFTINGVDAVRFVTSAESVTTAQDLFMAKGESLDKAKADTKQDGKLTQEKKDKAVVAKYAKLLASGVAAEDVQIKCGDTLKMTWSYGKTLNKSDGEGKFDLALAANTCNGEAVSKAAGAKAGAKAKQVKLDKGSKAFKGYTRHESFKIMSKDYSTWTPTGQGGLIIGFVVFAIGYVVTVIMIFLDMKKRGIMYQELIETDLAKLTGMGLAHKMGEYDKELVVRLAGKKDDVGVDDQLITQALELTEANYKKYM